ncbi:hypothetical protein BFJ70_g48 [Fusarium oxysporum]|uniref:Uncharacterized protein n=1 Tax=Fusarium oxysporum f. sp. cepae TaxID=396571 RepID=A0A3L6MUK2_FUSOX|nr:hypothetical protein FOMA001_g16543 [Fusarium oxysporum f. sp. matthiolae]RKK07818.1 hypothetical protein BFJ65_g17294 [Fusarium oxysporum f. sp. cepae]RKL11730.1 hypothetical protein BFJ71_g211 [Fusarium oxysporum]RKK28000.1 hypothetical protein BFJ67_g15813 [Fusarium oxysporum f. sp. cepae]RKK31334.1 hypothetical protein BFJ66_g15892 [Fusarium oxysporum f. sp. cepae]
MLSRNDTDEWPMEITEMYNKYLLNDAGISIVPYDGDKGN